MPAALRDDRADPASWPGRSPPGNRPAHFRRRSHHRFVHSPADERSGRTRPRGWPVADSPVARSITITGLATARARWGCPRTQGRPFDLPPVRQGRTNPVESVLRGSRRPTARSARSRAGRATRRVRTCGCADVVGGLTQAQVNDHPAQGAADRRIIALTSLRTLLCYSSKHCYARSPNDAMLKYLELLR